LRRPGRPDVLARAVQSWSSSSAADVDKLVDAVNRADTESARRIAHTLRGSTASLGGRRLAAILDEVETHARTGDLTPAAVLLEPLRHAHCATLEALRASV
jgi:HPt (histidine-containing phosphotransfer) domain-containing protein